MKIKAIAEVNIKNARDTSRLQFFPEVGSRW
jgi:hypothetical protein